MNLLSTDDSPPILHLPTEILDRIFSSANIWQLAILRQVCSHWRCIVDKPSRWQKLSLILVERSRSAAKHSFSNKLWTLDSLRYLLNPNLQHIRSLSISDVRDSNIRFILTHCPLLENLEIMSWNTLSNHALALGGDQIYTLRSFHLMGGVDQFLALDAVCLVHFILLCPSLCYLSIDHCRLSIHPDMFLKQLWSQLDGSCLNTLTTIILSSLHQPWSRQHADQLLLLCPSLHHLRLESKRNTVTVINQMNSRCVNVTDI